MKKFDRIKGFDYVKCANYQELTTLILDTDCNTHELGLSSDGEMVYGLSVGDLSKPMIFIDGVMHGHHEWRSAHWVKHYMDLLMHPTDNKKILIEKMKANFCFYAIPCLNPYGYTQNSYVNGNGVNLNRNFPVGWDAYPTTTPFDAQYKGSAPFSEPESKILKNIIDTYNVILHINNHVLGEGGGGHFEIPSTGRENIKLLTDGMNSLQLTIPEINITVNYATILYTPWVYEWVCTQPSKCGKNTISLAYETGSTETDNIKSELGMTSMFVMAYHIYNWFKTRKMILN